MRQDRRGVTLAAALVVGMAGCAGPTPAVTRALPAALAAQAISPAVDGASTPTRTAAPGRALTIAEAIAEAIASNPDLRAAAERIGAAEARLGEASAAFYPQVGARLSYLRSDNPLLAFGMIVAQRDFSQSLDVNHPGATQGWRPEIGANLSLFRGGEDWARRGAAKLGVEAAGLERDALRNALSEAVVEAYYGVLAAEEQAGVARASVEAIESGLADARARVEAGKALRSDELSLEVRLAAAREGLVRARNGIELARAAVRYLLALPPEAPVVLAPAPAASGLAPPATISLAFARAREGRPEIAAAERLVEMRERAVDAAQAGHLPRVSAFASYGQDAPDLELSRHQDNWTVGAMVEVDIFSGFATSERVAEAEHGVSAARAAAESARLGVERDVSASFIAFSDARERAQVSASSVAAAEEALRLVKEQYAAGAATVTRYLEAESALADARARRVAAGYGARRAEASLVRSIGGWK